MSRDKNMFSNFVWRFLERCGAQGISFIVTIVLARLLLPEMYGTIALVTVFLRIMQVFIDSGMGNALIQKKNVDDTDFSTVFYFNLVVCSVLYVLMFFIAPVIAKFYNDLSLVPVIRVLSLVLLISGVKNIQQAYVSRNMLFKRFFFATLGGTIVAAVLGIWMAYRGYGVWALVAQQLTNAAIDTLILWITVRWRPKLVFSFQRLKGLFSYGWKLLASGLLDVVYNDLRQLIIGKLYSSSHLAYYNKGEQFPRLFVSNVNVSIDSILFPVMSRNQDSAVSVKNMTRKAIKLSTYIMAPFMMGMAFCSKTIVTLLLTEKWLDCVPFMCIFCITYMFYPIHTANLNAIKAMGRSDLFLKLEIAKKVVGLMILFSTMWFGVMAMAYSLPLSTLLCMIINAYPNKKLLKYSFLEQMKDILPGILLAVFMGVCVYFVQWLPLNDWLTLLIQVILGALIYIGGSKLFQLEAFSYIISVAKGYLHKRAKR